MRGTPMPPILRLISPLGPIGRRVLDPLAAAAAVAAALLVAGALQAL